MDEYLTKWDVNENLLQSYRSISIASQSFLLAVGSLLDQDLFLFLVILASLSIFMLWFIWYEVVQFRHFAVDYYKYILKLPREQQLIFSKLYPFDDYMEDSTIREKARDLLKIPTYWRKTRKKIDRWIPIILTVIWILLVIFKYLEYSHLIQNLDYFFYLFPKCGNW